MNLRDAYRVLELGNGAGEDVVRDARKTLSKVWHPDRYTNDPALQAKAAVKLREINEAFEVVRAAGFPATAPAESPRPEPPPPKAAPPAPAPSPAPEPSIEFVPRRRVRWPVILALFAALGIGTYFAILELGARDSAPATARRDPDRAPVVAPDGPAIAVTAADAALAPVPIPTADRAAGPTYTLGARREEVLALQGEPNGTESSSSSDVHTVNGRTTRSSVSLTKLVFGHSEVELVDDKVVGWWDNDVRLHVRLDPHDPSVVAAARARGTLATGQTSDDALGVLGAPARVATNRWSYGTSQLELDASGTIVGATRGDVDLHLTP